MGLATDMNILLRILLVMMFAVVPRVCYGVDKYVDPGATGGGTGNDWANAYTSLASAANLDVDVDALNEDYFIYCKTTGGADTTAVTFDGWVTSADDRLYVIVEAANRHDGSRDSGYYISAASNSDAVLNLNDPYITIVGLSIENTGTTDTGIHIHADADYTTIVDCLVFDCSNGGIYGYNGATNTVILNTAVVNSAVAFYTYNTGTIMANCTAMGGTRGFYRQDYSVLTLYNCAAGGTSTADFSESGTHGNFVIYNSWSEDTTSDDFVDHGGSGNLANQTYSTAQFTNVGAGTENPRLVSGSSLIGNGQDIDAQAFWDAVSAYVESAGSGLDFKDTVRDAAWDIGFDEYIASGPSLPITYYYRSQQQ